MCDYTKQCEIKVMRLNIYLTSNENKQKREHLPKHIHTGVVLIICLLGYHLSVCDNEKANKNFSLESE